MFAEMLRGVRPLSRNIVGSPEAISWAAPATVLSRFLPSPAPFRRAIISVYLAFGMSAAGTLMASAIISASEGMPVRGIRPHPDISRARVLKTAICSICFSLRLVFRWILPNDSVRSGRLDMEYRPKNSRRQQAASCPDCQRHS
ncbi:hypothetical protein D3C84_640960 [compost metagenome]